MVLTGKKRWLTLVIVSLLSGIMVYVPYLRFNYYDQMVLLFSEYNKLQSHPMSMSLLETVLLSWELSVPWDIPSAVILRISSAKNG